MTQSKRIHRSQPEWQAIIDEQAASTLSVKAFCAKNDIGHISFCNWRRRLSKGGASSSLIDLSALVNDAASTSWLIELDLGNGIKLNLRQS